MSSRSHGQMQFELKPSAALVPLDDGSARLLDLEGNFFGLSSVAARILADTLDRGVEFAISNLVSAFNLTETQATDEVHDFIKQFQQAGLIQQRAARHCSVASNDYSPSLYVILRFLALLSPVGKTRVWLTLGCAYVAVRMFRWPKVVATWRKSILKQAWHSRLHYAGELISRQMIGVTASHLLPIECKERSLACWSLLHACDLSAELVVGIDLYPFASHCWCELDGEVIGDSKLRCEKYRRVFVYGCSKER